MQISELGKEGGKERTDRGKNTAMCEKRDHRKEKVEKRGFLTFSAFSFRAFWPFFLVR